MDSLKSRELKPLTFSRFLQTDVRSSIPYLAEFRSLYSDIENVHSFVGRYSKMLSKTPQYNDVNPMQNGLDGTTILIDKIANAGPFFDRMINRPKTISELLMEVVYAIDVKIQSKDIAVELQTIKKKIGVSLFDPDMISDAESLNSQVNVLSKNLEQLASDVWNDDESIGQGLDRATYNLNATGRQSQQYTVRMLLNQLKNEMADLRYKVDTFIKQNSNRITVDVNILANQPYLVYSFDTMQFTGAQIQTKYNSLDGFSMGKFDILYYPANETIRHTEYATINSSDQFDLRYTIEKTGTNIEVFIQATATITKYSLVITLFE